ncbi:MAG: type I DNA topoisomerase [Rhodospirillaceae bacterium]|jgi:DNA topoisomerase-1|nr:type I DNA topoisomerase [Rhodospirillaceae bacterium]
MKKIIVIVESPAKAKTINKYLGENYVVLASYGHIRDLPSKKDSVRPDDNFSMNWTILPKSEKHIKEIIKALKESDSLILATDPDREGEAISWHICRVIEKYKSLNHIDIKRVVFNEITKGAISKAMSNPRDLDQKLVNAYLARTALDYLVGFNLSPVLWHKLPGSPSAGRVQSVALRLICEREIEIENFHTQEYWTIEANFLTTNNSDIAATLTHLDGVKLDKFDLADETKVNIAETKILTANYHVESVERKQTRRYPYPPFTTSTLQQEASSKLFMPTSRTMKIAQELYEGINDSKIGGLITYMRTDSTQMATEAINAIREHIKIQYGLNYLPSTARIYKTKTKNAQEAHEAIRPTNISLQPKDAAVYLNSEQLKLYELIWHRTVASQMECAIFDQIIVIIASADSKIEFRANGSIIKFDGFRSVYFDDNIEDKLLPNVINDEVMKYKSLDKLQHFTKPPSRYSEAGLIKKLEELGIGRPSTYAPIIFILQKRNYAVIKDRSFIPEDRGRVVTAFLENFFSKYVQYNFTAELEKQLDDISYGNLNWKTMLHTFWNNFSLAVEDSSKLSISDVLDKLNEELLPHFFQTQINDNNSIKNSRTCTICNSGQLSLKVGKFGVFIGCSNYPECRYTRPLTLNNKDTVSNELAQKLLGKDLVSGMDVILKNGPYGYYVQLGETKEDEIKPKRVSLYRGLKPEEITLDKALKLLELPRIIGKHPESGELITANIGKFGPYIKHGNSNKSLKSTDDVLEIDINRAVEILVDTNNKIKISKIKKTKSKTIKTKK